MSKNAPGKAHRKGLTLLEIADMFRDKDTSREWIAKERWPNGPHCPYCGTFNVQSNIKHKTMTHRCRECERKPMFTLRTGSIMEGTKLKYRVWAVGMYLITTNIKGVSSMRVHRELGISQKAAWFMLHRLRLAFEGDGGAFAGPVEADETYIGGKRKNMSNTKRNALKDTGRGPVGKEAVAGVKDSETKRVCAKVVQNIDKETLQGFVVDNTADDATVYTDEASDYEGMPRHHEAVKHSVSEYVRGMAHTNGMESFWSILKRGHQGIYQQDVSEAS